MTNRKHIKEQKKQRIIHDACKENNIHYCICNPCKEEVIERAREQALIKAESKGFMEGYIMAKGYDWLEECVRENWVAGELISGITPPPCAEWPHKNNEVKVSEKE